MINNDGLRGMTSNPAIFEKAIADSSIYDTEIQKLALKETDVNTIYETISQKDVQNAADIFRPLYEQTNGDDGYVSLEVNPHLAYLTIETIEEGRRLWTALNRPNVMIKVPATIEGMPAIRKLTSEGININVTLLFGLPRYRTVAEAYVEGLEERLAQGKSIDHISSVASFFLSRIDLLIDPMLEKTIDFDDRKKNIAMEAHGEVAISSAKAAYQIYKEIFGSPRFKKLKKKGAREQRLLWASTSNKNPDYIDVKYVETLIGKNTVNTLPPQTIEAYRDHGNPELSIGKNKDEANWVLSKLPELGIDLNIISEKLEEEGIRKFIEPFDKLMETLAKKSFKKENV